jgi:hypothetical protein
MNVALSPRYRLWMWLLLPATLGVGTAGLWARSLSWPCSIDAEAITLRSRRKLPWTAIRAIAVRRDYFDGRIVQIQIHFLDGGCKIPAGALRDGESAAATIVAMFKAARRPRPAKSFTKSSFATSVDQVDTSTGNGFELKAATTLLPKPRTARHVSSQPMSNRDDCSIRTDTAA